MTWYRTGTVAVTNGSANVTLTGGDALQNIFPDDGFIGPDGKTYGIATIGGAGSFTLQTNYGGPTASGQAYGIIPVADYVQLRDQIEAVNTLITAYQTIAINAGVGLFAPGSAAAPGVRGQGHTGTGLVWNGDNTLSVSVAGTVVATFTTGGNRFPDGTVGAPGMSFVLDTNTGIYRPASDTLGIVTGGVERARISSGGNFGLGTTPTVLMHIRGGAAGATQLRLDSSVTQPNVAFYNGDANANNRNWAIVAAFTSFGDLAFVRSNAAGGDPLTAGTTVLRFLSNAQVIPGADNSQSIGSASFRWSLVYAATGTINTSDEREKTWRGAPTKDELKAATAIIAELGFYQWNDAVADKVKDARYHFGVRAQRVWSIMAENGLVDPIKKGKPGRTPYAFLCYDEWKADKEASIKAGNRYGVRTDQLIMFLMAAQEARIAALEERLNND